MSIIRNFLNELKKFDFTQKIVLSYIFVLPFMQITNMPIVKQKIQISEIIFSIFFIGFMVKLIRKRIELNIDIILKLAIFLILCLIPSFINAQDKLVSSIEFIGIIYLVIMFGTISLFIKTKDFWLMSLKVWMLASLIIASFGIGGYVYYIFSAKPNTFVAYFTNLQCVDEIFSFRVRSFFQHPNMLATYMHVSIVFIFILMLRKYFAKKSTGIFLAIVVSFLAVIMLSKSRMIAGVFLSCALCFMPFRKLHFRFLRYIFSVAAVLCIIFVILITTWWIFPVNFSIDSKTRKASVEFNVLPHTYLVRNKAAVRMVMDHPFLGVGMGGYYKANVSYTDWDEAILAYGMLYPGFDDPGNNFVDPHSTILGWTAETGFFGFIGIVSFFVGLLVILIRRRSSCTTELSKYILWIFIGGELGFLVNSFYIDILTMRHFWFMNAMAVAYLRIAEE